MTTIDRPLPMIDRDSQPYWKGMREGELRAQRCTGCGKWRWPARAICGHCRSFETEWQPLSGIGRVISWIRTHQVFSRAFQDDVPYVTVLVRLDEQPDLQMIGAFASPDVTPAAGMTVRAVIREVAPETSLVLWEPA